MSKQLSFSLFPENSAQPSKKPAAKARRAVGSGGSAPAEAMTSAAKSETVQPHTSGRMVLRRAVCRWLEAELHPQGMMVGVPTRNTNYKADVAAFWSKSVSNQGGTGPKRLFQPAQTMVVECFEDRDQCRLSCSESSHIIDELCRKRQRQEELEADIRRTEPNLRCSEALFEDFADWDYTRSVNLDYQKVLADIRNLEEALQKGTRFERIQSADMADCLYAAVPAGLVVPQELGRYWGLLWVYSNLEVEVKKRAVERPVPEANRVHLIQNISAAGKNSFLALQGLRQGDDGVYFVKPPRLHRKRQDVYCHSDVEPESE